MVWSSGTGGLTRIYSNAARKSVRPPGSSWNGVVRDVKQWLHTSEISPWHTAGLVEPRPIATIRMHNTSSWNGVVRDVNQWLPFEPIIGEGQNDGWSTASISMTHFHKIEEFEREDVRNFIGQADNRQNRLMVFAHIT